MASWSAHAWCHRAKANLATTFQNENALMDEYRNTLMSAVEAACHGDLQALLIAQWMLSSLRSGMARAAADHATPAAQ